VTQPREQVERIARRREERDAEFMGTAEELEGMLRQAEARGDAARRDADDAVAELRRVGRELQGRSKRLYLNPQP
jgi:hypothetical protein